MQSKRLKQHGAVLLLLSGLVLLMQYQLVFNIGTHIPGNHTTDYPHFHWNMWWIGHALETGQPIFSTDYVMYPAETSMAYHTLAPIWYPLWAVLEPLLGQAAGMSMVLMFAAVLNGYAVVGWLRAEDVTWRGAILGGVLMLSTSYLLHVLQWTVLSMLGWFWIPLILILMKQSARSISHGRILWPWMLLLAACVWGIGLTDFQYFFFGAWLILPLAVRELLYLSTPRQRIDLVRAGIGALLGGIVLLSVAGPLPELYMADRSDFAPATEEIRFTVRYPDDYFSSPPDTYDWPGFGYVMLPMMAITSLILLSRRRTRREGLLLAVLAIVPIVLMGGNTLVVAGVDLTAPHRALYDVFGGLYRYPVRWTMIVTLLATLMVGRAVSMLRVKWLGYVATMGLAVIILADTDALAPTFIQAPPMGYAFYDDMADDEAMYTIIESPVAAGTGESLVGPHAALSFQYSVVTHGKRITGGHFSRAPISNFLYLLTDDPLLSWLGQRRFLDPELVEAQLQDIVPSWPLGYIVLHFDHIGYDGSTLQEITGYFNSLDDLLCPAHIEGDAMTYRSTWHPDGCPERVPPQVTDGVYQIDIGGPEDWRYLGWGWHRQESVAGISVRWTGDWLQVVAGLDRTETEPMPQAALYVDLPPASYRVTYEAQSFERDRTATLFVNGTEISSQVVPAAGLAPITFDIRASVVGDGRHLELMLIYDDAVVPEAARNDNNPRQLALMINTVTFALLD